ncbi:MAG: hypothetical protein QM784_22550 [Polyangiaceae bacterium]
MSYFRALASRASGAGAPAFASTARSPSPIAAFDQRLNQPAIPRTLGAPAGLATLGQARAHGSSAMDASEGDVATASSAGPRGTTATHTSRPSVTASVTATVSARVTAGPAPSLGVPAQGLGQFGAESRTADASHTAASNPFGSVDSLTDPLGRSVVDTSGAELTPAARSNHDALDGIATLTSSRDASRDASRGATATPLPHSAARVAALQGATETLRDHDEQNNSAQEANAQAAPTNSAVALRRALEAIEAWMRPAPAESRAPSDVASAQRLVPAPPTRTRLDAAMLGSSASSASSAGNTTAASPAPTAAALPSFHSAPRVSIGRIDIEILRAEPPPARPSVPTRVPRRPSLIAPSATPTSTANALDAKRNFGMRQR